MVYENCKFYGPYLSKKDNRLRCIIVFPDGKKKSLSYPKYLIEVHLDRYLDIDETVHHIDGNPLNNEINNLMVINRKEHCYNDSIKNCDVVTKCSYCGKEFTISGNSIYYRNRSDRKQSGYFCSKSCSGKYGKSIQLGNKPNDKVDRIIPKKYRGKSAPGETQDVDAG